MVYVAPVPAIAPGFIIQLPAGRPFSTTLPVATVHVGCVIKPAPGADGTGLIVTTAFPSIPKTHEVDTNVASTV